MRTPIARFPFIISFQEKIKGDNTGNTALLSLLQNWGEELKTLSMGNREKLSNILKKLVFLESALDELTEAESMENDEKSASVLIKEEKQEMDKFFSGLIPILDSLDAACRSAAESEEPELTRGFEMLNKKFAYHLSSWGLTKSSDVGMKFDSQFHEAVGTSSSSSLAPGLIMDVIEHGWTFESKILRFAKVIVVK